MQIPQSAPSRPFFRRLLPAHCLIVPATAQSGRPDHEGFIRDWLFLVPLSIGWGAGTAEIDEQQFADEAQPVKLLPGSARMQIGFPTS
jgi:hypothetical protein